MKLAIKLAIRNLLGAGLRTWLNVIVLSFSFVVIIFMKGVMKGWDLQAKNDMTEWEIANGQYWHENYDPLDPFSLNDSHAPVPEAFKDEISSGEMIVQLVVPGTLYPGGRLQSVAIRGIDPGQRLLKLPAGRLDTAADGAIPAIIGSLMAKNIKATEGDRIILQWRDVNGTFDAGEILVAGIFSTDVPSVETGQIYIPLERLREMMSMPGEATILTFSDADRERSSTGPWIHKPKDELTRSVDQMIKTKSAGQVIMFGILLLLAMLAIFDTQILSIFRRQKEIGTYVALGYTRGQVVGLFTVEGTMYAILAAMVSAAYGLPFLAWMAKTGWTMPIDTSDFGMAIAQTLYPVYSMGLVISTVVIITAVTAAVSYWPSRRIAKMNPTDALRGKLL
jgi:ABC-type lipoprotein release transport system permease subunit